jgi:hypothetical protein
LLVIKLSLARLSSKMHNHFLSPLEESKTNLFLDLTKLSLPISLRQKHLLNGTAQTQSSTLMQSFW